MVGRVALRGAFWCCVGGFFLKTTFATACPSPIGLISNCSERYGPEIPAGNSLRLHEWTDLPC